MKLFPCPVCGKANYLCPKGIHEERPGRIHSGPMAPTDCDWECPHCKGFGVVVLTWSDRLVLYFFEKGRIAYKKLHPGMM